MKINRSLFGQLMEVILEGGAKKATKYLDKNTVVKATLHGKPRKNERTRTILVTSGRPNYAERKFIGKCLKVGEPFPVKKIQIAWQKGQ